MRRLRPQFVWLTVTTQLPLLQECEGCVQEGAAHGWGLGPGGVPGSGSRLLVPVPSPHLAQFLGGTRVEMVD